MNRCIDCVNYKMVVIRCNGKYKGCQDGFCELHKKLITKDGCCEAWHEQKNEYNLSAQKCKSGQDGSGIFVIDLDEL